MGSALIAMVVFLGIAFLLVVFVIGVYNALVRTRNQVDNAWSQIDVQLKRRHDLIPNLVETAKGYMKHERETFEAITQARSQAVSAKTVSEHSQAEGKLADALSRVPGNQDEVAGAYRQALALAEKQAALNPRTARPNAPSTPRKRSLTSPIPSRLIPT